MLFGEGVSRVAQTARSAVSQAAGLRDLADSTVGDTADMAVCATGESAIGCPTWIRTMNNASKGRCVTVTPSDNLTVKVASRRALRQWIYDMRYTIYGVRFAWSW